MQIILKKYIVDKCMHRILYMGLMGMQIDLTCRLLSKQNKLLVAFR